MAFRPPPVFLPRRPLSPPPVFLPGSPFRPPPTAFLTENSAAVKAERNRRERFCKENSRSADRPPEHRGEGRKGFIKRSTAVQPIGGLNMRERTGKIFVKEKDPVQKGKALFQGPDEGALAKGPDRAVSSPSFAEGLFGCPKAGKRSPGKRRRGRTGEKAEVRRKNHKNFLFSPFKHLTRKWVFGIIERLYGRSVCKFCPPAGRPRGKGGAKGLPVGLRQEVTWAVAQENFC